MEIQPIKAGVSARDVHVHVGTQPLELGIESGPSGLEKIIRHKFDKRILPLGIAVHILSTIDRSNMSNAVVLGLRENTDLSGDRFNVVLALFFVTYIVFEIPANLMCQKFGPRIWLSLITFGFGVATVGTSFTHSYPSVLGCRLLLGMFEAGVQPGLLYTYSQFYRRHEMASRWGIKAVGGSVAGAFGGLLGSALGNVPKFGMFERWRWIFLVEGLMTIIVSGLVYWYMPASAAEASFLTDAEKEVAIRRIDQENKMMVGGKDLGAWSLPVMKRALWNANTQLVSLAIMMTLLSMTSLSLFMTQKYTPSPGPSEPLERDDGRCNWELMQAVQDHVWGLHNRLPRYTPFDAGKWAVNEGACSTPMFTSDPEVHQATGRKEAGFKALPVDRSLCTQCTLHGHSIWVRGRIHEHEARLEASYRPNLGL
ncbi:hypothetical protein MY3296_009304 [Beauveria thailandica]